MAGFYPDFYADSLKSITAEFLSGKGIEAIWLDIDNTISLVDDPAPTPEGAQWVERMKNEGFIIGLVSNNDPERVEPFAESLGLIYISHAEKPKPQGYLSLCKKAGVSPDKCVMVGDQLVTDVLGGNRAGILTIAVAPINTEMDPKNFRKRRKLENILMAMYRLIHKKRIL